MVSGRSPHTGFGSSKGCSRWRGDTWSVGMVAMGVGLDLMILEIFSDLSDSMVPCYTLGNAPGCWEFQPAGVCSGNKANPKSRKGRHLLG